MSTTPTTQAVRATWLHYAQLAAQIARAEANRAGDLFPDAQCPACGLFHASAPCHPYMSELKKAPK